MARPFGVKPKQLQITAPVSAASGWIEDAGGTYGGLVALVSPTTRRVHVGALPDSDNWGSRVIIRSDSTYQTALLLQSNFTHIKMEPVAAGGEPFDIAYRQGKQWQFGDFNIFDSSPGFATFEAQEDVYRIGGASGSDQELKHRVVTGANRLDTRVGGSGVTSLVVLSGIGMSGVSRGWGSASDIMPFRQWLFRAWGKFTRNSGDVKLQATIEADTTQELLNCVHTPSAVGSVAYLVEILMTLQGESLWHSDGSYATITSVKYHWIARCTLAQEGSTAGAASSYLQRGSVTGFQQHDNDLQLFLRGGFSLADSANLVEKYAESIHFT